MWKMLLCCNKPNNRNKHYAYATAQWFTLEKGDRKSQVSPWVSFYLVSSTSTKLQTSAPLKKKNTHTHTSLPPEPPLASPRQIESSAGILYCLITQPLLHNSGVSFFSPKSSHHITLSQIHVVAGPPCDWNISNTLEWFVFSFLHWKEVSRFTVSVWFRLLPHYSKKRKKDRYTTWPNVCRDTLLCTFSLGLFFFIVLGLSPN